MKKLLQKSTTILFTGFIGILTVANVFAPKQTVSWNENRTLSSFPSFKTILSGRFDDEFETWFSDHFIGRDLWIGLKSATKKAAGAIENNGIYYGKNDYLIPQFQSYPSRTLKQNIYLINSFCEEMEMQGNILLIPSSAYGAQDALPSGSYDIDQKQLSASIEAQFTNQNFLPYLDLVSPDYSNYFHTDHHWNEKGAYLGYACIVENVLHQEPKTFTYALMADDFQGTSYSKSGAFWNAGDPIYQIIPDEPFDVTLTYEDGTIVHSLYNEARLDEKDKYMYYLDGNHAYVKVQTSLHTGKKAVIVKDSYAHILMPYLASEYDEITMIDLRYYQDPVSAFLQDKENTDLYFIYSLDNFCSDPNMAFLR